VKVGFIANATLANANGGETILAAVSGKSIKVRHLTINSSDALTVTIGEGITGAGVTTALIGPVALPANGSLQWTFNPLMELTLSTALTCDASGAGNICVFVQGVIE
jgi:hypothetical protein